MKKSLKGKILTRIIIATILLNIILTAVINIILRVNLENTIKGEMGNIVTIARNILRNNSDGDKVIENIEDSFNSYIGIVNKNRELIKSGRLENNSEVIENIIKDSENRKVIINFNKSYDKYISTYIYPIYIDNEFSNSLVIQKDYTLAYENNRRLLIWLIGGQIVILIILIGILSLIIDKIINPLNKLAKSLRNFGLGQYTEDIVLNDDDEISEIADTFNNMKKIITKEKETTKNFFHNATHELKTPVTAISAYAQMLRDNELKDLEEDFITRATERMVLESKKMQDLVEKLLELGKIQVTKNEKVKSQFNYGELIRKIIDNNRILIEKRNRVIKANIPDIEVITYKSDLEQIILNLLDNSIKYSKGNVIDINLEVFQGEVVFKIENEINELPEDIKDKLFDPFIKYTEISNLEKEITSSGVGLYFCKELSNQNSWGLEYFIKKDRIVFVFKLYT